MAGKSGSIPSEGIPYAVFRAGGRVAAAPPPVAVEEEKKVKREDLYKKSAFGYTSVTGEEVHIMPSGEKVVVYPSGKVVTFPSKKEAAAITTRTPTAYGVVRYPLGSFAAVQMQKPYSHEVEAFRPAYEKVREQFPHIPAIPEQQAAVTEYVPVTPRGIEEGVQAAKEITEYETGEKDYEELSPYAKTQVDIAEGRPSVAIQTYEVTVGEQVSQDIAAGVGGFAGAGVGSLVAGAVFVPTLATQIIKQPEMTGAFLYRTGESMAAHPIETGVLIAGGAVIGGAVFGGIKGGVGRLTGRFRSPIQYKAGAMGATEITQLGMTKGGVIAIGRGKGLSVVKSPKGVTAVTTGDIYGYGISELVSVKGRTPVQTFGAVLKPKTIIKRPRTLFERLRGKPKIIYEYVKTPKGTKKFVISKGLEEVSEPLAKVRFLKEERYTQLQKSTFDRQVKGLKDIGAPPKLKQIGKPRRIKTPLGIERGEAYTLRTGLEKPPAVIENIIRIQKSGLKGQIRGRKYATDIDSLTTTKVRIREPKVFQEYAPEKPIPYIKGKWSKTPLVFEELPTKPKVSRGMSEILGEVKEGKAKAVQKQLTKDITRSMERQTEGLAAYGIRTLQEFEVRQARTKPLVPQLFKEPELRIVEKKLVTPITIEEEALLPLLDTRSTGVMAQQLGRVAVERQIPIEKTERITEQIIKESPMLEVIQKVPALPYAETPAMFMPAEELPFIPFGFGFPQGLLEEEEPKERKIKQRRKYRPSLTALLFGIKGKQPKGLLTGFELRPITKRKKGKRRKKK